MSEALPFDIKQLDVSELLKAVYGENEGIGGSCNSNIAPSWNFDEALDNFFQVKSS